MSTESGTDGETKDGILSERMAATVLGICMPSVQQEIGSFLYKLRPSQKDVEATGRTLRNYVSYLVDQALGSYLCSMGLSDEGSKLLEKSFTIPTTSKNFDSQVNEGCE